MTTTFPSWSEKAAQAIAKLAERPWCLFCVLLAFNALARPYSGIVHDARLYSAQVLHHLDPLLYHDDLFFRYGSQDQYSIFSRCAAPFVNLLGLELSFFLLYLVFNGLLILALKRLVETLLEDRLLSTLALAFMVVVPLNFGGLNMLQVQESFLTPRLIANALVLFGLERILRQRYVASLGLMALAMAFHPLMAVGGFFIWTVCAAWRFLPAKVLIPLVLLLGAAGTWFLATPELASRYLGTMDDRWRDVILMATPFNFVSEWQLYDWINIAFGLIGVAAAAFAYRQKNATYACLLMSVTVLGVVAVVGTAVAENLPYALPLQGQPYRALWILKVVQIPFAFWFAARFLGLLQWYGPPVAAFLLCFLGLTTDLPLELCLPLFFLPFAVLRYRGMDTMPRFFSWWSLSLVVSVVLGAVVWAAYKIAILLANYGDVMKQRDLLEFARLLTTSLGPLPWVVIFACFAVWLARRNAFSGRLQGALVALLLLIQGGNAYLLASPYFRENYTCHGQDIRFVQDYLRAQGAPASPTIYSCLGRLEYVWLDLHAQSYFDWWQMSGVMFQRQMALEGQRRAIVVGPFEMDRFRESGDVPAIVRMWISRFFALDYDSAHANLDHFKALCQEEGIDFLLLTREFPGWVAAGNGSVFLYDCRQVRAALNDSSPVVTAAAKTPGSEISP